MKLLSNPQTNGSAPDTKPLHISMALPHDQQPNSTFFYALPPRNPGLPVCSGILAGGFGGVAGIFALFFFAEVPRVRVDIMQKVPILGSYFINEIPPEDNPF